MDIIYTPRDEPMELSVVPMDVECLNHMGSDLDVVNDARVSFAKTHHNFVIGKDDKLINYLAKHKHWTPFAHGIAKFRIKAPIFVARQLHKHQVGMVVNEVSRRYVDSTPEFYLPEKFRYFADNKKQGSHDSKVVEYFAEGEESSFSVAPISNAMEQVLAESLYTYQNLLDNGVAPEQARAFLPLTTMTEWVWTGSLASWARVCNQRLDAHAQQETREIAEMISKDMKALFPISWKALMNHGGTEQEGPSCESHSSTQTSSSTSLPSQQKTR